MSHRSYLNTNISEILKKIFQLINSPNSSKQHRVQLFSLLMLFVLSFSTLFSKIDNDHISPYDEMYHLSYVQHVYEGRIPKTGDEMNTWSKTAFSCRPVFPYGMTTGVPCGEIGDAREYPEGSTNTAAIWPPGYYIFVAALLKLFFFFGDDPVYLARLATTFLWSLGTTTIAYAALRRNNSISTLFSSGVLLCSLPFAYIHGAFVTPHSTTPLLVGIGLLLYGNVHKENWSQSKTVAIFGIFAFIAVMTQPHFLPVIAVLVVGLMRFFHEPSKTFSFTIKSKELRTFFFLSTIPTVGFLTYQFWDFIQTRRFTGWAAGLDVAATQQPNNPPMDLILINDLLWRFFPESISRYSYLGQYENIWTKASVFLLIGTIGSLIFNNYKKFALAEIAIALLVFSQLYSLYLELVIPVAITPRYGIGFAILAIGLIPDVLRSRRSSLAVAFFSGAVYISLFNAIPFFGP